MYISFLRNNSKLIANYIYANQFSMIYLVKVYTKLYVK